MGTAALTCGSPASEWLGRKDSNLRMPESKSGALTNLATPQRRNLCAANAGAVRTCAGIRFPRHANAASGCRASVRATNPRMAGGLASTAARASASGGKRREHAARPTPSSAHAANARASFGAPSRCPETARPRSAEGRCAHNPRKRRPFSPTRVSRVNSGAAKIAAVDTAIGGTITATHNGGSETGVKRSPMPRASAGSPPKEERNVGAERDADSHELRSRQVRSSQSRLSASSTVAASELPPPMPPPIGMRFVDRDVDARTCSPSRRLSARAARTARSCCRRDARQRPPCARSRRRRDASA